MTWLGNAGWRVLAGDTELLVDPYLSRFPTGLAAGAFDPATPLRVDEAVVAAGVGDPNLVLVTHTHWDHVADVPHIATTYGARVVGTLTTHRVCESMGVPASSLLPVKGGEQLDLGDVVVRVVPSRHSRTGSGGLLFPGVRVEVPARPRTIADLPEGDTLAFVVSRPRGPQVYFSGASDLDDQVLDGIEPDVATIAVPSNDLVHEYVPRLLEALGRPRTVVPVHWDDFESPRTSPPKASAQNRARLEATVAQVRRVSPRTRVVVPDYDTPLEVL
jgi:L-ascorbate metabolism protein UlaG (beta-lactamase superfamily)